MPRGRPPQSVVRSNILEILFFLPCAHGYKIAKWYNDIFPEVAQRTIYYHLKKGVVLGEIEVHKIVEEKGEFSWGNMVEKTYYSLSNNAQVKGLQRVKKYLERQGVI